MRPMWLDADRNDFSAALQAFVAKTRDENLDVRQIVSDILLDVRENGDLALRRLTRKFDEYDLGDQGFKISHDVIEAAYKACPQEERQSLELAAERIWEYHLRQKPEDLFYTDASGVGLGYKWSAVESVGLYVPGGLASYPSSVLMNAIPAKVAGAKRLVMVVPTPKGKLNTMVLAAAKIAGVDEIYPIGGAQAIAALAYGTPSIKRVDKIVGPGNAFVAEAKRQVYGVVGIDTIAGPSEILVIADSTANPAWIAADLLSQAEHDELARAVLVTTDTDLANEVCAQIEKLLADLPKKDIASTAWQREGAIVLVSSLEDAADVSNAIAPEHLELAVADPHALMEKITHAGAIFLGHYTPEALGDYIAGPSHVLPTSGAARFSSGLSVLDFMKRSSIIEGSPQGIDALAGAAITLANGEGLHAHAISLATRLGDTKTPQRQRAVLKAGYKNRDDKAMVTDDRDLAKDIKPTGKE